jgi:molecular chaperone HscB
MTAPHPSEPAAARPAKCDACDNAPARPLYCDACHTLHVAAYVDHFQALGLAREYDVDAGLVRRRYLAASRALHPDRLGGTPDADALRAAARLNEAQRVLADPVLRAEYLLELAGGPSAAVDKRVPPEVLAETLERRETIDALRAENDSAGMDALIAEIERERSGRLAEIAALARKLPGDAALHGELRLQLNALKYQTRLLEQARGQSGGEAQL